MAKIIIDGDSQSSEWVREIAEKHNADHDLLDYWLNIIGITQPDLEQPEKVSQDHNFFRLKSERESLALLLTTGLHYLTMGELRLIPGKVWKLTEPDQTHFHTFFPNQVHAHPGLATLSKLSGQELTHRTYQQAYSHKLAPIDTLALILGDQSKIFQRVRHFVRK